MADLETDYLVVGAGVSGMGFVDGCGPRSDADFIIVDTRHRPGGHWNDAYPFVQLHQPAAAFGADSLQFRDNRIDETGPNAGFYQLASAPQVVAYYEEVLEAFRGRGNVRFLGATQYCGMDGEDHVLRSTITGATRTVSVRRRLVDSTYAEPKIPSRHTPSFGVDTDARFVPPNALVELGEVPGGFTVLGAGKTAIDACSYLLSQGVDPNAIRWVRPRDVWLMRRAVTQPLKLLPNGFMKMQAAWVKAAAEAATPSEMAPRLEAEGALDRLDMSVEPTAFRGATVSDREIEALRQIDNVVRMGHVLHLSSGGMKLEQGELSTPVNHVYVDCTAGALRDVPSRPVFEPGRITMQITTLGNIPFSSATIGVVEAFGETDEARNDMCQSIGSFGDADTIARGALTFLQTTPKRMFHPEVGAWLASTRLNSARVLPEVAEDPDLQANQKTMMEHLGPAMENLARLVG
jgi:hypothetical protein